MSGQSLGRFTERSRKTLDYALREALSLGHNYVGTEHLLLALLRDEETMAYRTLISLGLTEDKVRNELLRLLNGKEIPPSHECEHEWHPILRIDTDADHPNAIAAGISVEQHLDGCDKCGQTRYWTVA